MKITKILSLSALTVAAIGLAACADTDAQYTIPTVDAPVLVSTSPANGDVLGTAGDVTINVKYDKRVFFASQKYTELQFTGGTVKSACVYGQDSVLTIVANVPNLGTDCSLTIPSGLVTGPNKMSAPEVTVNFTTKALPTLATSPVAATSTQAVKLYNYLLENYRTNIISGMMADVAWNNDESEQVYEWTGKYPAINGYDYIHLPASAQGANWINYSDITPVKEYTDNGGIACIGWHWLAPKEEVTEEETPAGGSTPLTLVSAGVWEGDLNLGTGWGVSSQISASDLADVKAGDEVTLYFSENSDATYWQAKPCVMSEGWPALTSCNTNDWGCVDLESGATSYSFTLNEDDAAKIKANGMVLSGYNITYSKMTIVSASTGGDDTNTTVWSGEQNMGTSWGSFTVEASKFAKLNEGDALVFTFTENNDATYWQIKPLDTGWTALTSLKGLPEVNDWDCVDLSSGATSYSLTLNATDVEKIKASGLLMQGYNITYTNIAIAPAAKLTASVKSRLAKSRAARSRVAYSKMDPNNDFSYAYKDGAGNVIFDLDNAVTDGTWENKFVKADLERVATYIKALKDAGIPVLWRPLHEAAGNIPSGGSPWFWWGKNATSFKKLWIMMFDYFKEQGLDNLIWVWTSVGNDDDWYPGDAYVDVVGRDLYGNSVATCSEEFQSLQNKYGKIVTLSECGVSTATDGTTTAIGTIADQWAAGAKWSWFMPWYNADVHTTKEWWQAAMQMDNIITRDKVNLK